MDILLMYGGKSCEHDISIVTAKQVLPNINGNVFEVYIDKNGCWHLVEDMSKPQDFIDLNKVEKLKKVTLLPDQKSLFLIKGKKLKKLCDIDVAVLCFHGVNGEDGSIQGLLQLCDIPHTSCGVVASGVSMDKIVTKTFLKGICAPVVDGFVLEKSCCDDEALTKAKEFGYPLIIKPANLGSSIGISIAKDDKSFLQGLKVAFNFDNRLLIERALKNCFDVNVSVFGYKGEIFTSLLEKPTTWHDFLSFEDKYKGGSKGVTSTKRQFPYHHPKEKEICDEAKDIYSKLGCKGVVRIDFLVCQGDFFVNEINTIPGSFAFYLWKNQFNFKQLVQMQIEEGIYQRQRQQNLTFLYNSDVLKTKGGKK